MYVYRCLLSFTIERILIPGKVTCVKVAINLEHSFGIYLQECLNLWPASHGTPMVVLATMLLT